MVSLDISDNSLGAEGAKILAEALKAQQQLVCDDGKLFKSKGVLVRSTCRHCGKKKDVHATRGALSSLDLSDNGIPADQLDPIERLCESKQIGPSGAIIAAAFLPKCQ